ncbi:SNF2 family N-terminal domain-containing protein [Dichomitus squalens]|uniref:SNF2 family N-terminal domain-containing protein n=1 Tax=Dichomitus squalens TaxID=114155 RepID=A0A4Q9PNB7_9APHY|nr:SNF2 family N-terminal domain-containing protein [Dichomitus squalens]
MRDYIPGMEVRLLPHQLIGVSWMVDQELHSPHKGGILADDMGLGKTVQMIATMVVNQPKHDDEHHSVLIVVPAALLLQWKEELEAKTNGMWEVHIQHGKDKIKDPHLLAEKDVVITTYHTLNLDFNIPKDVDPNDEMAWLKRHGGPLSRIRWYRVVLDEAQFIRNRSTRCSRAVAMLRAKYRWCLTGTPITNTLADIYGYLRFGHFRPFNDWNDFNDFIAKMQLEDAPLAGQRAQTVLMPLMMRRRKDATIDGEPILKLQPKHIELVTIDFSQDERDLYDMFEKSAQIQVNRYIRNNTVVKNHQHILVLILRLRQVCAHPYLILSETDDFADPTALLGSEGDKELARATKQMGPKWVSSLKKRLLDRAVAFETTLENDGSDIEGMYCPRCGDVSMESTSRVLSCGHEICEECVQYLSTSEIEHNGVFGNNDEKENLRAEKEFETAAAKGLRPCPTCKKMQDLRPNAVFLASAFMPTRDEVRAAVRAARRRPHSPPPPLKKKPKLEIIDISDLESSSSDGDSDDSMPDVSVMLKSSPRDKGEKTLSKPLKGKAVNRNSKPRAKEESDVDSDSELASDVPKKGMGKKTRQKSNKRDSSEELPPAPDANLLATWKRGGSNVESSAKMMRMVAYLKEWESTGDKTIVFSQWTSMLDLCEQIFSRHGIRSLRYDGSMSREAREYCLAQFRQPGGPKVILVSLKCGGVGLNLVSANRVINLDLSWNYAAESQAYDRVHRLGQEKEVFVKRLIIRNTIEERMLALQETKLNLAGAALGEGGGGKLDKLSIKQIKTVRPSKSNLHTSRLTKLAQLFGMTKNNNRERDRNRQQNEHHV